MLNVKLDKSPKTMARMFNKLASHYDLMNDVMTIFNHRWTRKIATQLTDFKPDEKALDLATGTGDFAFLLLKNSQGTVIGVDISFKMLAIALAKSRSLKDNSDINFNQVDINNLPFSDEVFDVCTIGYGIRNVHNPLSTMKEIARVTKKGGRFIILETTPPPNSHMRFLALFHFSKIVPLFAKLLSTNVSAYNYFAESMSQFPKALQFGKIIKRAGWSKVFYYTLYFGIVTIFLAIK